MNIFDRTLCKLGEGPIWHPLRESLIWFDILDKCLFERPKDSLVARKINFEVYVSAAGWVNQANLLVASSNELLLVNLDTGNSRKLVSLESKNSLTRSNDGRADPFGGFWIGTMGIKMEKGKGSIYRFYKGELRKLFASVSIPNSICFSPEGKIAYFTDTIEGEILRVSLDSLGWPKSKPDSFVNCRSEGINPDGSVVDSDGCLWNAQWGSSRVARYNKNGELIEIIELDVPQASCPAFGGENFSTLFVTSALTGMSDLELQKAPLSGATFYVQTSTIGQKENQVKF